MNHRMIRSLATVLAILASTAPLLASEPTSVAPLLKTTWAQRREFAAYTPNNARLGCWSTAIAQILRYHQLQPHGEVQYTTSDGTILHLAMDGDTIDWDRFPDSFQSRTPARGKQEVARYIYCVSLTIQKDFGTGSYRLGHSDRADAIAEHFDCRTRLYSSPQTDLNQLTSLVRHELDQQRPVMMHIRRRNSRGDAGYHAVAVDGYKFVNGVFTVHINMGWGGRDNGWYPFTGPIGGFDDGDYRKIMTIVPDPSKTSQPAHTTGRQR